MFNEYISVGSRSRQNNQFRVSLGNNTPRYNSQVAFQRKKYLISSTKDSEDAPDWMSRTQSYHFRQHNRNNSLYSNAASPFNCVQQTYVYARVNKPQHPQGQFDKILKKRERNKWDMKNSTFQFQWPKNQKEVPSNPEKKEKAQKPICRSELSSYETAYFRPSSRPNYISKIVLPKYAYKQSPLHVQKQTPIKIGHPYMLDSTCVK